LSKKEAYLQKLIKSGKAKELEDPKFRKSEIGSQLRIQETERETNSK